MGDTDKEAMFERAICANPSDEHPRLIYADWLEENGDDRAYWLRTARLCERCLRNDVPIWQAGKVYADGRWLCLACDGEWTLDFGAEPRDSQTRLTVFETRIVSPVFGSIVVQPGDLAQRLLSGAMAREGVQEYLAPAAVVGGEPQDATFANAVVNEDNWNK